MRCIKCGRLPKLTNARLTRAEKLTKKEREEFELPDEGLVIIESRLQCDEKGCWIELEDKHKVSRKEVIHLKKCIREGSARIKCNADNLNRIDQAESIVRWCSWVAKDSKLLIEEWEKKGDAE